MDKNIEIKGQNNRYQIKKLLKESKDITKKQSLHIDSKFFDKNIQPKLLPFLIDDSINREIFDILTLSIKQKQNSYLQQDKKSDKFDENFININDIHNLLELSKSTCYYCNDIVYLLYKNKLFPKQWTLDRIDNNKGHSKDNVVICCLECNLQRKNMKQSNFIFNKNLKIVKKDT